MEKIDFFKNYKKIAKEIKELVNKYVNAKIYVFGSIVKNEYCIGLSDIDIAIVSEDFKNRNIRLKIYDILFSKYFESPLEFHLLTPEKWNLYLKFIDKFEEID
jgi:predicted nucleotidyltransferase